MRFNKQATEMWLLLTPIFLSIFGWLSHIFYCFDNEAWGFLIAGAIFFPIGIIHGFYVLF